jgi:hypothetical protein
MRKPKKPAATVPAIIATGKGRPSFHSKDGAHISTYCQEACMADGELSCITVNHIQAGSQNNINANQHNVQFPERPDDFCIENFKKGIDKHAGAKSE